MVLTRNMYMHHGTIVLCMRTGSFNFYVVFYSAFIIASLNYLNVVYVSF